MPCHAMPCPRYPPRDAHRTSVRCSDLQHRTDVTRRAASASSSGTTHSDTTWLHPDSPASLTSVEYRALDTPAPYAPTESSILSPSPPAASTRAVGRFPRSESAESSPHVNAAPGGQPYDLTPAAASTEQFASAPPAMIRHPASPPLAECGSTISPASDRGELVPETATTAIDAQSTMARVVHAHETCQIQTPGTPGTPHSSSHSTPVIAADTKAASAELKSVDLGLASPSDNTHTPKAQLSGEGILQFVSLDTSFPLLRWGPDGISLDCLPNEILLQILGFLDVSDLLTTSRITCRARVSKFTETSSSPLPLELSARSSTPVSMPGLPFCAGQELLTISRRK
ncbi:hypothetical protein NPX13_g7950 [Xylaria arbuscula]|uniref:F-box domain-containing protein n=1 Tax=Xylaria arbuscula TaxID=114810 RepID=A0A9W8N9N8_9PEZI|nr:hypothetical protein NPX13_g7950 [Xylaria arbuscula]